MAEDIGGYTNFAPVRLLDAATATGAGPWQSVEEAASNRIEVLDPESGTWEITPEIAGDDGIATAIKVTPFAGGNPQSTITTPGVYRADIATAKQFRLNVTANSGGTISAEGQASTAPLAGAGASTGVTTGTLTDRSGTITTGGTAQQVMAANASRKYLLVQNTSSGDLWVNFTTAAVINEPSIRLIAGGSIVMEAGFISTEAVSIIGATTGQAYTAKEA